MKTLFDTTHEIEREAAAVLCGMDAPTAAFRSTLRLLPAIPDYTIGDIARAYLHARLAELARAAAENKAAQPGENETPIA